MNKPTERNLEKEVDSIQQRLTDFSYNLTYEGLPPTAIQAAKMRIVDTLGSLIGGFYGEPCRIVRDVAAQIPDANGATVIGTRWKTTPEMAAFVNGTTARYPEMIDSYHGPGSAHGHVSETILPVLAAAEYAQASGRDFITAVVLAYEVFIRISDVYKNKRAFDGTNLTCIGTAAAAAKLLALPQAQTAHAISMAVTPNLILHQISRDHKTMFKAVASGHSGRAGVFAALLAQEGMEGPHLPFEGKAGWCAIVAGERFSINTMGGNGTPFKISETQIKLRPAAGGIIGCVLAAEKIAPLNVREVKQVTVEVSEHAKLQGGTYEYCWNPDSLETGDHSIPYAVASTLKNGTLTLRSYNDANLWDPDVRAMLKKVEVVENPEFTKAMERKPVEHRNRITVVMNNGERLVGESGGGAEDLAAPKTNEQIEKKFHALTEDVLSTKQAAAVLNTLWHLEELGNVAELPPALAFI